MRSGVEKLVDHLVRRGAREQPAQGREGRGLFVRRPTPASSAGGQREPDRNGEGFAQGPRDTANMSRAQAVLAAERYFDEGRFFDDLARRVAIPTESQNPERPAELERYLESEMRRALEAHGLRLPHRCPTQGARAARSSSPSASRIAQPADRARLRPRRRDPRPTTTQWRAGPRRPGRSPSDGDRWYGRGTADNKGQHTINIAALEAVLRDARQARLQRQVADRDGRGDRLARPARALRASSKTLLAADVLIASDGPRLAPTGRRIFLGSRGALNFDLVVDAREGGHHSGNWGGLLANPGIHARARASPRSSTRRGADPRRPNGVPQQLPTSVRARSPTARSTAAPDGPTIDPDWGEPGLTPAERVFGWCALRGAGLRHRQSGDARSTRSRRAPGRTASCASSSASTRTSILPALRRHLDRARLSAW